MRESFIRLLIIFARLFCLFIGLALLNLNYEIKVSLITFAKLNVNTEKIINFDSIAKLFQAQTQEPCFKLIFYVHLSKINFHSLLRTGMFVQGFRLTVLPRNFCVNNFAVFYTIVRS